MDTTQLSCPHCGSMLNLGGVIAPGTPVTCLICMEVFAAQPSAPASPPAVPLPEASPAPKPRAGIPVAKPHVHGPVACPHERPTPRRHHAAPSPSAKSAYALLGFLGLLVFGTVGGAFAVWKLDEAASTTGAGQQDNAVAKNDSSDGAKNLEAAPNAVSPDAKAGVKPGNPATVDDGEPRSKDSPKAVLTRGKLAPTALGSVPPLQPIKQVDLGPVIAPGVRGGDINSAIDRGVAFLRQTQKFDGAWIGSPHQVGTAALGGLTLLECQVPPDDLAVQRAASYVRSHVATLPYTYEIALAILFLDRLGDPEDHTMIQGLALRLAAGQRDCGGWTYDCPVLAAPQMAQLLMVLQATKPAPGLPLATKEKARPKAPQLLQATSDPFQQFGAIIAKRNSASSTAPKSTKGPLRLDLLLPPLRQLPLVRNHGRAKNQHVLRLVPGAGDNSNTQFALLALWTARRHDVPTDSVLLASHQRFVLTQLPDHGWSYHPTLRIGRSTNTMTAVGLLGLAMGHGVAPDRVKVKGAKEMVTKPALQDPGIVSGLKKLASYLDEPAVDLAHAGPPQNMYFLWSVERVAMLYDLKKIDGMDWYPWGAQILVKTQHAQGDWPSARYPGQCPHVNTCFALLFLKRSNLVKDLTTNLLLVTSVPESEK